MRRVLGAIVILTCLLVLFHDAGSGRFRTFRKVEDGRYEHSLFLLAEQGDMSEVRRLIRMLGVNTRNEYDETPLHHAGWGGHTTVAELLISKGAEVNAGGCFGEAPLHRAAEWGHTAVAELLIANGADLNAESCIGDTPLHWAAGNGQTAVAELLIAKGADVNARSKDGRTPLDSAAGRNGTKITTLLRKHGGKTGQELDQEGGR